VAKDTPFYGRDSLFASNWCNHFAKMSPLKRPHYTFYQTGCDLIYKEIFIIPLVVLGTFFSFRISDQRKEAKELRLD
jgi:hypothetical protein